MSDAHADAPELTERIEPVLHDATAADHAHAAAAVSAVIQDEGFFSVGGAGGAGDIPSQAIVDAVLRWHNRHPLAVRLTPADVGGLGRVQFPFQPPLIVPAPKAKGWKARWSRNGPAPAFDDDALIPGLWRRSVVAFAQRRGSLESPGDPAWPTRALQASQAGTQPLYLLTAAYQVGGKTRRVLLSTGVPLVVLGRRQWSWLRLGLLVGGALLAGLLTLGGTAAYKALTAPPAPKVDKAKKGAAAASAAHADAAAEAHDAAPAHGESSHAAASAAHSETGDHAAASAAVDGAGGHGQGSPSEDHDGHGANKPAHDAAPGDDRADGHDKPKADKTEKADKAAEAAKPQPPGAVTFALVSAPTWRPTELQAMQREMSKILGHRLGGMKAEVMRTPEGEVLAVGPLPTQAAAEEMAARLGRYGIMVVPINF